MRLVFKREHYGALIITYFVPFVYILTQKGRPFFLLMPDDKKVRGGFAQSILSLTIMWDKRLAPLEKGPARYKIQRRIKLCDDWNVDSTDAFVVRRPQFPVT